MRRQSTIEKLHSKYLKAVVEGSEAKASSAINSALRSEIRPLDIYLKIILPAERRLGELWLEGKISIAQEHLGTEITLQQFNRLRPLMRPTNRHGKRAVVTSIEGDQHYLGARVCSDFLYVDGWEVDFLGASTPTADLVNYLKEKETSLLVLSVTIKEALIQVPYLMKGLETLGARKPKVVLGGAAIESSEQAVEELGADAYACDPLAVTTQGRRLCEIGNKVLSLDDVLARLGSRIREVRKSRGLSQQELADNANLDRAYISGVENGKQNVSLGAVIKISSALDLPFEELLVAQRQTEESPEFSLEEVPVG